MAKHYLVLSVDGLLVPIVGGTAAALAILAIIAIILAVILACICHRKSEFVT